MSERLTDNSNSGPWDWTKDPSNLSREQLIAENAALRTRAEQAERERACPCLHTEPCDPRCTCVSPWSSRGCSRCCSYGSEEQQRQRAERLATLHIECDALRAEAGRLRAAAQILLDGIFEVPVPRSDAFYQAVRVPDIEKMTEALSSTPLSAAAVERVRLLGEWPRVWATFQKAENNGNLGLKIEARKRLDELALTALDRTEEK